MKTKPELLSIQEASELLGVHSETLRRWDRSGKLPAIKVGTRGDRKYRVSDIQKIKAKLNPTQEITENDLIVFVQEKVSLSKDKTDTYREQVNNLRKKLEDYIKDNPEFDLIKMLHSGSVQKGTALSTRKEMDVAVYMKPDNIEEYELLDILEYVQKALVEVYEGQMSEAQFTLGTHCVRVNFKGKGLDVDVVPVIYKGKSKDRGDLLNRDTGEWVETSIPLHLDFIRARKKLYPLFGDLVRMTKWWRDEIDFKFKSFLIELIWCHLVDTQSLPESRIEGFAEFLSYVLRTQLKKRIIFTDYYKLTGVKQDNASPVQIYDPVNPENNLGSGLTDQERLKIVSESQNAFNALSLATEAYTKRDAVENWQKILGSSFNP